MDKKQTKTAQRNTRLVLDVCVWRECILKFFGGVCSCMKYSALSTIGATLHCLTHVHSSNSHESCRQILAKTRYSSTLLLMSSSLL